MLQSDERRSPTRGQAQSGRHKNPSSKHAGMLSHPRVSKKLVCNIALADLVDVELLQRLQDLFAEMTGISAIIRDLNGHPVTRPSCQNKFCGLIMKSDYGERNCRESNRHAVMRAAQEHRVVKYVCHAGLAQFAAPIESEGICVGTIVMGDRLERRLSDKRLLELSRKTGVSAKKLASALAGVGSWSQSEMARAVNLLVGIANAVAQLCYQGVELRAKLKEIETLYKVSKLLAGTLDLSKLLKLVAKSATDVAEAKGCSIRLLDSRGERLVIKSFFNLSQRYLDKGPVLLKKSPIDKAALKGEVVQIPDMQHDPRVLYPKEAEREGIRSGISLGLISKQRPIGTLHLYSADTRHIEDDEVLALRSLANQAAVAIENAQLYEQSVEKHRLDRELHVAGSIQRALLPEKEPNIEGYDIAAISIPCSKVGGDFYDFVPLRADKTAFIIADVAGKGIPGALLMASARAGLRAHLENTHDPREATRRLNINLCHDTRSGTFVSLFCGVLNHSSRLLRYTNAGHNPPLVIRKGRTLALDKGGLVLGAEEGEQYEMGSLQLQRGDIVCLYTDGVTEALNSKDDIFGQERFLKILKDASDANSDIILARTQNAVRQFARNAPQSDDITIVVMRVR